METVPSPTPQPRILIFDHSQDAADVLAMRFVHHGCEIKRLYTLENLPAEALSFGPDLILLDVEVRGASGFRAARRLRREPRLFDTWLVALGGGGRLRDIETAENAGFDECLSKPLTPDAQQELLSEARKRMQTPSGPSGDRVGEKRTWSSGALKRSDVKPPR